MQRIIFVLIAAFTSAMSDGTLSAFDPPLNRDVVRSTPGLVAFWDFDLRESSGNERFIAHVPSGSSDNYPLDAANYVRDYWGEGRQATYADFPIQTFVLFCSFPGRVCTTLRWTSKETGNQ